jgi:hypothetical protein
MQISRNRRRTQPQPQLIRHLNFLKKVTVAKVEEKKTLSSRNEVTWTQSYKIDIIYSEIRH